jgi:hypothetical protein
VASSRDEATLCGGDGIAALAMTSLDNLAEWLPGRFADG